jgi:hypothetical protein
MEIVSLLGLLAIIVLFFAAESYQMQHTWPVARAKINATWPMRPTEGFANMTLEQWLPSPEVVTKPAVGDCPGTLMNAAGYDGQLKIKNYDLLSDRLEPKLESRIASGPTAEECYGIDYTNTYERSSYAQRTNNYKHVRPDSCSAPNQDLILGFYK